MESAIPSREAGYDVRVITLPSSDVRLVKRLNEKVYGVLAAPPCTHFCSSGARRWAVKGETALLDGLSVVDACIRIISIYDPVFWALGNPVGRLVSYIGPPTLWFQPWEYGDPYTKKTGLWGRFNIPERTPCQPIAGIVNDGHNNPSKRFPSKMHLLPPTTDRATLRSITPPGFAEAFFKANQ